VSDKRQRFPIGALVRCAYDFEMIFPINFGYDDIEKEYHYGIVVAYEPEQYDGFSNWYDFYVVLCFDGVKRYFADFEIRIFKHP
jgi:hypothetical protein